MLKYFLYGQQMQNMQNTYIILFTLWYNSGNNVYLKILFNNNIATSATSGINEQDGQFSIIVK